MVRALSAVVLFLVTVARRADPRRPRHCHSPQFLGRILALLELHRTSSVLNGLDAFTHI